MPEEGSKFLRAVRFSQCQCKFFTELQKLEDIRKLSLGCRPFRDLAQENRLWERKQP